MERFKRFNFLYGSHTVFFPFVYFVVLVLLYIFVFRVGVGKVITQRKMLSEAKKSENILIEKENVLNESKSVLVGYVTAASLAYPEKNPSLVIISQIKSLVASQALVLESFKIEGMQSESVNSALSVSFKVSGTLNQITSLLKAIRNVSPIMTLDRVELSDSGGISLAEISIKSYWASFPDKIPSITQPIKKFTKEDLEVLLSLSKLTAPSFTNLTPQSPSERKDPFK